MIEIAADKSARHAAHHKDREEESRCTRVLPTSDEKQRQKGAERTVRPAAQPHREVQRNRCACEENARELRTFLCPMFRQRRNTAQSRTHKKQPHKECGQNEQRQRIDRQFLKKRDEDKRHERHARIAARDEIAHHAVPASVRRRPSDKHRRERMIRRCRCTRHGNKQKEQYHIPRKAHHTDRHSGGRDDVREHGTEVPPIHQIAEDGLQHIRRHGCDHDKYAAHRERQSEFQHEQRQEDRQEIRIEVHHCVPCREQCRCVPYLVVHDVLPCLYYAYSTLEVASEHRTIDLFFPVTNILAYNQKI